MKQFISIIGMISFILFTHLQPITKDGWLKVESKNAYTHIALATDTCIIEGLTFKMLDYKSTRKLKAYIKNSQIYVENKGLQYSKYRITYYIFSSMDDDNMPVVRHFDQRLAPPILTILKTAEIGTRFLFEEITVVDPSNKELTNAVKPILLERIKN